VMSGTIGNYIYTWYSKVYERTGGTETELSSHTLGSNSISTSPIDTGISVTYDEATNIARVVCFVQADAETYLNWRSYDCLSLDQTTPKGVYYGWGWGTISGAADTSYSSPYANARHVDYCQGFPHVYYGITEDYHEWLKSTMSETATLEVTGVSCGSGGYYYGTDCDDCAALNSTFDLARIAVDQIISPSVLDSVNGVVYAPENLCSDEIDAGCTDTNSGWTYKIQYRLVVSGTKVTLCAFAIPYNTTPTKIWFPILLARADVSFAGKCNPPQYDGANAIDGLVFDDWTNSGIGGAPVEIREIIGGQPVGDLYLTFPDFSGATATITLP
jgi:hypothetical protein